MVGWFRCNFFNDELCAQVTRARCSRVPARLFQALRMEHQFRFSDYKIKLSTPRDEEGDLFPDDIANTTNGMRVGLLK